MVADGIGGHAGGERASALAIHSVDAFTVQTLQWFTRVAADAEDKLLADFQKALQRANAHILAEGQVHPELQGMGTTLTLAFSLNDTLFVAHVGDSRCYHLRGGELLQLTRDHTLVGDMVRGGLVKPEMAAKHELGTSSAITSAAGRPTSRSRFMRSAWRPATSSCCVPTA